jgi:SAM-dependent methyltransferase
MDTVKMPEAYASNGDQETTRTAARSDEARGADRSEGSPFLSVVIPAYNEASTIEEIIRRVQEAPFAKEIIVVDDGSTDGTRDILAGIAAPNTRVILHDVNRGKGGALRTGLAAAAGQYVIIQDADLEYDPRDYQVLLAPLVSGDADVVFGSRFLGGSRRVLFFWHMVANKILTLASNMVTNLNLTDMETGYKAFRRDVVRRLTIESRRFDVEPEITAKVARLGCRVYEVPISYHGRSYEEGKKIGWRDAFAALVAILRYGLLGGRVSPETGHDTLITMDGLRGYSNWTWRQIAPHVGQRVLEAGSGTGTLTRYLSSRRRLVAVDVDDHYVTLLSGRYADRPNVRVMRLDLSADAWPDLTDERIDTVVSTNVLEHVRDDEGALRRLHGLLVPGGRLVLLVPAHTALFGSMDRALGHHRRYDRSSLRALLTRCGFEVESLRLFNTVGAVGWFVNGRVLRRGAVPALQAGLFGLAWPLVRLVDALHAPLGLSILAVASKPDAAAVPVSPLEERGRAGQRVGQPVGQPAPEPESAPRSPLPALSTAVEAVSRG